MAAIEVEFIKNKSRFKCLHFSDQMSLMIRYLTDGQLPFEKNDRKPEKRFQKNGQKLCHMMRKKANCTEMLLLEDAMTRRVNVSNYNRADFHIGRRQQDIRHNLNDQEE